MSIFKKAQVDPKMIEINSIADVIAVDEHNLLLHVAKFADRLTVAANENYPHYLCLYLYELAGLFMKFYENCPILKDNVDENTRNSRLAILAITAQTLQTGLSLLGIDTVDKM
jgi:arginyl-tRNA synthetase